MLFVMGKSVIVIRSIKCATFIHEVHSALSLTI